MRIRTWLRTAALAVMVSLAGAGASAQVEQDVADVVREHVNTGSIVHYTTGINPDDYPCARAGIVRLYEKRGAVADLGRWHPKRLFAWVVDTSVYYTMRFVDFLKGLMNPNAVANGIREVHAMATGGGNPLARLDRKVSGWANDLSPRSQYVLQRKVHGIIRDTTNADGSCKG